jgi:hypothetical protein
LALGAEYLESNKMAKVEKVTGVTMSGSMPNMDVVVEPTKVSSVVVKPVQARRVVRARISFYDALTGRQFRSGDIVDCWKEDRVREYEGKGVLVVANEVVPTEEK